MLRSTHCSCLAYFTASLNWLKNRYEASNLMLTRWCLTSTNRPYICKQTCSFPLQVCMTFFCRQQTFKYLFLTFRNKKGIKRLILLLEQFQVLITFLPFDVCREKPLFKEQNLVHIINWSKLFCKKRWVATVKPPWR